MTKKTNDSLESRVKVAVVKTWNAINADVDWAVTLDEVVELCLDAHRLMDHGGLSREDYDAMLKEDMDKVDKWGKDALRGNV